MMTQRSLGLIPRYEADSSWWQHVPVAHLLVDIIKPKIIVELGTHYGVSLFSFCEAAERFSQDTYIYAVDTWEGDVQAGYYQSEVYEYVRAHADKYHRQRCALLRCIFDEAANYFEEETIDILHIDGLHTYDAVKNDFERWSTKVREKGSIVFHDCNERKEGFGVWKLWDEIKKNEKYQCIELPNGHGLGIATLSTCQPSWHEIIYENMDILKCKGLLLENISKLKRDTQVSSSEMKELKKHIHNLKKMNIDKEKQIAQAEINILRLQDEKNMGYLKRIIKIVARLMKITK